MEKILILTDLYLPSPSSNGACAAKIADVDPDNIYVLSIYKNINSQSSEHYCSCESPHRTSSKLRCLFRYTENILTVREIFNKAVEIIEKQGIDRVVAIYRPVECLIAALELKQKYKSKVKVCSYFLDSFHEILATNRLKRIILWHNESRLLKKIQRRFDGIILLKYYENTFVSILKNHNKLHLSGIPNLIYKKAAPCVPGTKKTMVYAGSFYERIRNPERPLRYLSELCHYMPELQIHFYSWGCEEEVNKWKKVIGDQLVLHGRVPVAEAENKINSADYLFNMGNDLPTQVPGKLFEYFATGKPILNFCFRDNDPAMSDYLKYNNILLINDNSKNYAECAAALRNSQTIKFEEIKNIFHDSTPEFFVELVRSI